MAETEGFVNELFQAIAVKSYLSPDEGGWAVTAETPAGGDGAAADKGGAGTPAKEGQPPPTTEAEVNALRDESVSTMRGHEAGGRRLSGSGPEAGDREHRRLRRSRSRSRSHSPGR